MSALNFLSLPKDIHYEIFPYLKPNELRVCLLVSKAMKKLAAQPLLWRGIATQKKITLLGKHAPHVEVIQFVIASNEMFKKLFRGDKVFLQQLDQRDLFNQYCTLMDKISSENPQNILDQFLDELIEKQNGEMKNFMFQEVHNHALTSFIRILIDKGAYLSERKVCKAIRIGNVGFIQFILALYPSASFDIFKDLIEIVDEKGRSDIFDNQCLIVNLVFNCIRYFDPRQIAYDKLIKLAVIANAHYLVKKMFLDYPEYKCTKTEDVLHLLFKFDRSEILETLLNKGWFIEDLELKAAIKTGASYCVKIICLRRKVESWILEEIVSHNQINMLKIVLQQLTLMQKKTFKKLLSIAVTNHNAPIIEVIRSEGIQPTSLDRCKALLFASKQIRTLLA
ncbi:MAG: F-box-like [Chlamydiales bacterium]|jgi:hypothetical protein|nr:F-box-like [Chlamydiales bacterium]